MLTWCYLVLPLHACTPLKANSMAGKVCVVERGGCKFYLKALNCQNANALATIIVNSETGAHVPALACSASDCRLVSTPTFWVDRNAGGNQASSIHIRTSTPFKMAPNIVI